MAFRDKGTIRKLLLILLKLLYSGFSLSLRFYNTKFNLQGFSTRMFVNRKLL